MPTLSVCLIVKNEEAIIERCVNSLQPFADEICIYDTGSTDNTIKICKKLDKVKVEKGTWKSDFAWARNQSFSMATGDYIMWVDADDVINEQSQKYLLDFKNTDLNKYDSVFLQYRYNVDENDKDRLHFYRDRIYRRIMYPTWIGRIHETCSLAAQSSPKEYFVPAEDAFINHIKVSEQSSRNLAIFRDMDEKNEIFRGRDWCYYGNELRDAKLWDEAIDKYCKVIDFPNTWEIEKLNAAFNISLIYRDTKKDWFKALRYAYIAASCTKVPRADICCLLGDLYQKVQEWNLAIMWYEKAYGNTCSKLDSTFMDFDCVTWKPLINLCVCHYNLGNIEKANAYNNKALEIVPDNVDAVRNKGIFEKLLGNNAAKEI